MPMYNGVTGHIENGQQTTLGSSSEDKHRDVPGLIKKSLVTLPGNQKTTVIYPVKRMWFLGYECGCSLTHQGPCY